MLAMMQQAESTLHKGVEVEVGSDVTVMQAAVAPC